MTREEKLTILKIHLKRITKEFCEIWGTCHEQLAREIDEVMIEIEELSKDIETRKNNND
jgi:adenosyl cobinamide kinase/adenosyl cobinamide phosphate guanylyltransferase